MKILINFQDFSGLIYQTCHDFVTFRFEFSGKKMSFLRFRIWVLENLELTVSILYLQKAWSIVTSWWRIWLIHGGECPGRKVLEKFDVSPYWKKIVVMYGWSVFKPEKFIRDPTQWPRISSHHFLLWQIKKKDWVKK